MVEETEGRSASGESLLRTIPAVEQRPDCPGSCGVIRSAPHPTSELCRSAERVNESKNARPGAATVMRGAGSAQGTRSAFAPVRRAAS